VIGKVGQRSGGAEEQVSQQTEDHDIQANDEEQSDMDFPIMLGQSSIDRLQLLELGDFVAVLRLHGFSFG
jgi:hypothetical protein